MLHLQRGQALFYKLQEDGRGRMVATNITIADDSRIKDSDI
jgi:hypothetical protein